MGDAGEIRLLIIADDLTGSNDAGAQFAKCGIRSIVLVEPHLSELPRGYPVVVVNTESRHVTPREAARRVARVTKLGVDAEVPHFFKKTDSTLRGNIAAELKALLEFTGERCIPFIPAFPEMGRTTRGGIHYVHGIPIAETAFSTDPLSPVRSSNVAEVLRSNAEIRVANASRDGASAAEAECIVFNCESREELRALAEQFGKRNAARVLSGSAAFAEELPGIISLPKEQPRIIQPMGPMLLVNGSLNPRAFEQVAAVEGQFQVIRLSPEILSGGQLPIHAPLGNTMLCSVMAREEYPEYRARARELGISENELHAAVARANGRCVKELLAGSGIQTLVVFGGDTLMGISREMGWTSFAPWGEIEAGVTVASPTESKLLVISKAGGFGDHEVLRRILECQSA